ncbi:MAG: hypothetical protein Q8K02_04740 [Flavobacterium sp.]|nr:hypothetical protein [Flavobacterium sp.]
MAKKFTKAIDIVWVEDNKQYLPSIEDDLKEIKKENKIELYITEENDSTKFINIAGNIPSSLVYCVDYNLHNNGKGINGDQVIKNIRALNKDCVIVFYSINLVQEELRKLIGNNDPNTYCVYRPNIIQKLRQLIEEGII